MPGPCTAWVISASATPRRRAVGTTNSRETSAAALGTASHWMATCPASPASGNSATQAWASRAGESHAAGSGGQVSG